MAAICLRRLGHVSRSPFTRLGRQDARKLSQRSRKLVLGIETSCDDTGAAVVDDNANVLGEALHTQIKTHVEEGGIIPPVARDLHKENIDNVVDEALKKTGLGVKDLDAVAVSVEPGLVSSLRVGLDKAVSLCKSYDKPLIPIHHMKAHALTIRLLHRIEFPFLVLLASGGHCLLAVARSVDEFVLLGTNLDDAPGECLDKVARRLRLKTLSGFDSISGGEAIERLAVEGNPRTFPVYSIMTRTPDCNFSFSGMKSNFHRLIETLEKDYNTVDVLPNVADVCASVQYSIVHHICRRLQRAIVFCDMKELLPKENRFLVLSGGVGSNQFIRKSIEIVCSHYDCELLCPPPRLCTDNGVMVAWNGMEKLMMNSGLTYDYDVIDVRGRYPMGENLNEEILKTQIRPQRIKLLP